MRIFWLPFIVAIALIVGIDWLLSRALWKRGKTSVRVLAIINVLATVATLAACVITFTTNYSGKPLYAANMAASARALLAFLVVFVPKLVWSILYVLGSIKWLNYDVRVLLKLAAAAMGIVTFVAMLIGSVWTPYSTQVNEIELSYSELPESFDGYRIVHISDWHLGCYGGDTTFVSQCIDEINALKPDMVCFTGDLVSLTAIEATPFEPLLARLKTRDGIYSVLGNHDYAHYMRGLSEIEQEADVQQLITIQETAGWTLLNNEHAIVSRGNDSIAVVGTANYGDPPFPVYGDYGAATGGLGNEFKIHLQHNPYMWHKAIVGKTDAHLTLSGHTHAMQLVVNMFGCRLSPASWRYDEWGGLYTEGEQSLYVNTGLGMVGPPLRVGVKPEITLITLKHK